MLDGVPSVFSPKATGGGLSLQTGFGSVTRLFQQQTKRPVPEILRWACIGASRFILDSGASTPVLEPSARVMRT